MLQRIKNYYNRSWKIIINEEKSLNNLFLFFTYFGLHVYTYIENEVYKETEVTKINRARVFSNALKTLINLNQRDKNHFQKLYNNHKNELMSYKNKNLAENTEVKHTIDKFNKILKTLNENQI